MAVDRPMTRHSGIDHTPLIRHRAEMRWERLIAEIGAGIEQQERDARDAEIADAIRHEVGQLELIRRLREAGGAQLSLRLAPGWEHRGEVRQVGAGWLLLAEAQAENLIATAHLQVISGLGRRTAPPLQRAAQRMFAGMDLRYALRGIATDRATVRVELSGGGESVGTIDRVGRDFIDMALHAPGEPRRNRNVLAEASIPTSAIAAVVRLAY